MNWEKNRKLLVSVFNPQEAREAVLGGGRIIDSEDPRSALGNIKPRNIMSIADAVLAYQRNGEVQLSTNIGEDQLLFDRTEHGLAIEKSPYEIAGKAAQSAIGVATAMDTKVHPVNIVKVGVDGMDIDLVGEVLEEVVLTLKATAEFSNSQVMAVLFVQDMDLWDARQQDEGVRRTLVGLREYTHTGPGHNAFDLKDYAVGTLRDRNDRVLFNDESEVDLNSLIDKGALPKSASDTMVALHDLFPHANFRLSADPSNRRTDQHVIQRMVDVAADAGAHSIMLDTRIQTKASRISLLKLDSDESLVDLAQYDDGGGSRLPREGVLTLGEIRFFVDYCHYRQIEANLAGSLQSYHAQQLWRLVPDTDQMSTRGGSTAVIRNPVGGVGNDSRRDRATHRNLVAGLVPPEHGGCLNIPEVMRNNMQAQADVRVLRQKAPKLSINWVNSFGDQIPYDD